ncbi:MAG: hypothetical protein C4287_14270 [Leptolyngbya sp. ERB_1_2]
MREFVLAGFSIVLVKHNPIGMALHLAWFKLFCKMLKAFESFRVRPLVKASLVRRRLKVKQSLALRKESSVALSRATALSPMVAFVQ